MKYEFTVEKKQSKNTSSGGFHHLTCNGKFLCTLEDWAFGGCGTQAMMKFSYTNWSSTAMVRALVKWFNTTEGDLLFEGKWPMRELYFCITDSQVVELKALVEHPNVRKLDEYKNKAHGDTHLHLYRLSVLKDFAFHEK